VDGTSEPGIQIAGGGLSGDGLILGFAVDTGGNLTSTSDGSTIKGLDIYGFNGAGIRVQSDDNKILNNSLGFQVTPTGDVPAGNVQGVLIDGGSNNTIGGTAGNTANTIEFNTANGIFVQKGPLNKFPGRKSAPVGNDFRQNSIVANGTSSAQDIDFSPALANQFPVAASLILISQDGAGNTRASFALTGVPGTQFAVEFFKNNARDNPPSRPFLTTVTVTIGGTGANPVTETFTNETIPSLGGSPAIATATVLSAGGTAQPTGTSRFSNSLALTQQIIVTTADDNGNNANPPTGSLRQAILTANSAPVPTTIVFQIGPPDEENPSDFINMVEHQGLPILVGFGTQSNPIPLPALTNPVIIDGFTEADFLNTLIVQDELPNNLVPRVPLIIIDTTNVSRTPTPDPDAGLAIDSGATGSYVRGLIFNQTLTPQHPATDFGVDSGILINGGSGPGSTVSGNVIGFFPFPLSPSPGNEPRGFDPGITILNSNNNVIGDTAFPPNAVSGNSGIGILIEGTSTGNLVQNTYVGTDSTGTLRVPNAGPGVEIDGAPANTIGGSIPLGLNVISANSQSGVVLRNGATNNVIQNTYIGTDRTGETTNSKEGPLGNGGYGVEIDDPLTMGNSVGGNTSGLINVISGNSFGGVIIQSGAQQNLIQNSYIGIDAAGGSALPNSGPGVIIDGTPGRGSITRATANSVGGSISGLVNVISGNRGDGVLIRAGATANVVQNSYIGLDATGSNLIQVSSSGSSYTGNSGDGVHIIASNNNTVGATATGLVNAISGNTGNGIHLDFVGDSITGTITGSDNTTIISSYIGTTSTGENGVNIFGNIGDGILITDANHTRVGFYTDNSGDHGAGNLISGNANGIHITDNPTGTSSGTDIRFNKIGTDFAGTFAIGNRQNGIFLDKVQSDAAVGATSIGGLTDSAGKLLAGNLISGNTLNGILVDGGSGQDLIFGNYIGTDLSGAPILGNGAAGIALVGSGNDLIGGTAVGAGNLVAGNGHAGILIQSGNENEVQGNTITANGKAVAPNLPDITVPGSGYMPAQDYSGVMILDASDNTIGGTDTAASNTITGNVRNGVLIANTTSADLAHANEVQGNVIGTAVVGQTGNQAAGVLLYQPWNNTVGGTVAGASNSIVGNGSDGVLVFFPTADNTRAPVTIADNQVSHNARSGIHVIGDFTTGTLQIQIMGNRVGTNSDGSSTYTNGIPLGNGLDGIRLEQGGSGSAAAMGTAALVSDNVSSGNGLTGIDVQIWAGSQGSALAHVSITGNELGTDANGLNVSDKPSGTALPFGNALDGLLLNGIVGVTVGGTTAAAGNVVSGNLGRGIELRGGPVTGPAAGFDNLIEFNLVGTDITGKLAVDQNGTSLGNLSDGIFLLNAVSTRIIDNVVSNNSGAGIHAVNQNPGGPSGPILIQHNRIGIGLDDPTAGAPIRGNGADGVFFDGIVSNATIGGTARGTTDNVISGNHANGINLFKSSGILIEGNEIGTNPQGNNDPNQHDYGNAGSGIFLNQSNNVTVGDPSSTNPAILTDLGNIISGNHADGVFVSGTSATVNAFGNTIAGNYIGLGVPGANAIPNAVAGIILSNAGASTRGSGNLVSSNAISGNRLDGILLVNVAQNNTISGNEIGTDQSGTTAVPNSADGVFLIGGAVTISGVTPNPTPGTISGNVISGNIISGNNQDGIQIFGSRAFQNSVTGNTIGLGRTGTKVPNGAVGVFLNDAGPANVIGGPTTTPGRSPGNVISGNNQSGIEISDTTGTVTATTVQGNLIGTDPTGLFAIGNGGSGVLIYGSSGNTIGGTVNADTDAGNVISGNSQAGIFIFTPAQTAQANGNVVQGNLIGTGANGEKLSGSTPGNGSEGVEIINGNANVVGGATPDLRNVISGNANNGVFIYQLTAPGLSASGNQVLGNFIGTDRQGTAAVPNQGNGVQIVDGGGNSVGGTATSASTLAGSTTPASLGGAGNLISGNAEWGVQITLTDSASASPNAVLGNYLGTDVTGMSAIPNSLGGVLVNNLSVRRLIPQTIGGMIRGAGNLISGNASTGIELVGPQINVAGPNNVVQGNVIGLTAAGTVLHMGTNLSGNTIGILISNSQGNTIGGLTSTGAGNVISGNSQDGVEITGLLSTANQVAGNLIGTNFMADAFPFDSTEQVPAQFVGVLINVASTNIVGGPTFDYHNVISGNAVGVQVSGLKQNTGVFIGSGNTIANNLIGTDGTGTVAVSNLDLGVFINNSPSNVIGPGNFVAANGIAGVEIFAEGSTKNVVTGNSVGTGIGGAVFPHGTKKTLSSAGLEPGIPLYMHAQLNGVVIIGASQNLVGTRGQSGTLPNTVNGNAEVGVYITNRDFTGRVFSTPVGNVASGNTVKADGIYGILLYNAPNNAVRPFTSQSRALMRNKLGGESIAFRNFLTAFDRGTSPPPVPRKGRARQTKTVARTSKVVHKAPLPARPQVPALFNAVHAHSSVVRPRHGK
jgi:parallel beta-helix repeat protein